MVHGIFVEYGGELIRMNREFDTGTMLGGMLFLTAPAMIVGGIGGLRAYLGALGREAAEEAVESTIGVSTGSGRTRIRVPEPDTVLNRLDGSVLIPLETINPTCFVAGTPILTPEGTKAIEMLKVGDAILSRPEDDPKADVRVSVVEKLFQLSARILEIRLGGQTIETTAEHPFYV